MNNSILNTDIQSFIVEHLNEEPTRLVLKGSPFPLVNIKEIVDVKIIKDFLLTFISFNQNPHETILANFILYLFAVKTISVIYKV